MFSKNQLKSFLEETIKEAEIALKEGNYPIGSVVVDPKGKIVAKCHNENLTKNDISAHAEILCLRNLGIKKTSKDIKEDYFLFSSLEPCGGCGFFIARTNIKIIYMAAVDPYKPGITELKKTEKFATNFKSLELIVCNFPDLALKSKHLMRDYFISKGRIEDSKVYE